jgi:NRAMP (natural resistance-associated macrophage protein)-like metal ion transporter
MLGNKSMDHTTSLVSDRIAARQALPLAGRIALHWGGFAAREKRLLSIIGPGWITGASDDDPSGIATYSQAGAQFGYGMAWVMLFTWPLMAAIQEISARIGRVTGEGIAGNIRAHYPHSVLRVIVSLLIIANILNLGADLGAMGAATHLLIGGSVHLFVVVFAVGCALLETFSRYERYAMILKWTSLALFAYVATALVIDVPWHQVAIATFVPSLTWQKDYIVTIVAVLGTTITPYCFFGSRPKRPKKSGSTPLRSHYWWRRRRLQAKSRASGSTLISAWDSPT